MKWMDCEGRDWPRLLNTRGGRKKGKVGRRGGGAGGRKKMQAEPNTCISLKSFDKRLSNGPFLSPVFEEYIRSVSQKVALLLFLMGRFHFLTCV